MPRTRADGSVPTPAERGKARAVLNRLMRRYPEMGTALKYENPWQLLVVTVLSAQTTDENVNRVAPTLFARYPTPEDLAEADPEEVERIIYSTGFYRQKAKAIVSLSQDLVEKHNGEVPMDLDALTKLRGVGRKTASVVLAEVWKLPAIAVDTHVKRVAGRLGLTNNTLPAKIEQDLMALYPPEKWAGISMRFIQFGRDTCHARNPDCGNCELFDLCVWPGRFEAAARSHR
ncbi:MAG TPA: endonuclease III [Acidimicrobiia bacterium]|jgi:endonuclease-3|nr:endonuclease III [Acidimicrobiia bacterium]